MVEFLIAIRRPDGSLPVIGDDDGGTLCPLVRRSRDGARGIYAVAASLFRRSDFAWAAGGDVSDLMWMRGTAGLDAFDAIRSAPPSVGASRLFPSGGYAAMRSGWDVNAHQMIVDVGPLGCPISGGHGHADLLSVQCVAFGEPILVDAGTGSYTADGPWRNYFRSTRLTARSAWTRETRRNRRVHSGGTRGLARRCSSGVPTIGSMSSTPSTTHTATSPSPAAGGRSS